MDDRDIQIGQRRRKYRKEKGMNQSELAEKIGKSLRTVQKYEKGEIEVAISVISDIAEMLGVSSSDILGYKSGIEHIGSLSDIMSFLFMLENVQDVDFKINVQKPSQGGKWECSISFDGQQNAKYNADLCLFLERWAEEQDNFRTYFSSLENYSRWKAETLAYYSSSQVETNEPVELDFETRMKKRKEYMEAELKKQKD